MLSDLLVGLAWIAIVMIPVIVAYRLPLDPKDGYFDRYVDSPDPAAGTPKPATPSGTKP